MWKAGYVYSWRKMEAAAQNRAGWEEEQSVAYVPPADSIKAYGQVYYYIQTINIPVLYPGHSGPISRAIPPRVAAVSNIHGFRHG